MSGPILCNIYLHELDFYIESLLSKFNKGTPIFASLLHPCSSVAADLIKHLSSSSSSVLFFFTKFQDIFLCVPCFRSRLFPIFCSHRESFLTIFFFSSLVGQSNRLLTGLSQVQILPKESCCFCCCLLSSCWREPTFFYPCENACIFSCLPCLPRLVANNTLLVPSLLPASFVLAIVG